MCTLYLDELKEERKVTNDEFDTAGFQEKMGNDDVQERREKYD